MQCKLAFLSVGIHRGTFFASQLHLYRVMRRFKNVVVIGCAWQQSIAAAQERKAEKAGFTKLCRNFSILFIQNMHLDIGWNLNLLLVMAL